MVIGECVCMQRGQRQCMECMRSAALVYTAYLALPFYVLCIAVISGVARVVDCACVRWGSKSDGGVRRWNCGYLARVGRMVVRMGG
jgi:hypothetical protein